MAATRHGPNRPETKPVTLDRATSAVAVLDLTVRCDDPQQVCSLIIPGVGALLDRARAAGVPIFFTGTALEQGTPGGRVATGLHRREGEPLLFPDGYDKFVGGDVEQFLKARGAQTLVIVGSSTHLAVMYTATAAARLHRYDVVIPVDGVNTANAYEHEYALHQLTVLPAGVSQHVQFTTLSEVTFR